MFCCKIHSKYIQNFQQKQPLPCSLSFNHFSNCISHKRFGFATCTATIVTQSCTKYHPICNTSSCFFLFHSKLFRIKLPCSLEIAYMCIYKQNLFLTCFLLDIASKSATGFQTRTGIRWGYKLSAQKVQHLFRKEERLPCGLLAPFPILPTRRRQRRWKSGGRMSSGANLSQKFHAFFDGAGTGGLYKLLTFYYGFSCGRAGRFLGCTAYPTNSD